MNSEKGQSVVELALVLPVLIIILLAIVDFGRVYHVYLTIDHAGREAARFASIHSKKTDNEVIDEAVNQAKDIKLKPEHVTRTIVDDPKYIGWKNVVITIKYPTSFITPGIGSLIGPFTLTNITTMRIE